VNVSDQSPPQFVAGQTVTPEFVHAQWSNGFCQQRAASEFGGDAGAGVGEFMTNTGVADPLITEGTETGTQFGDNDR